MSSQEDSCSRWDFNSSLLLSGRRKSAFIPYRPTNTVLTNLQRGNTETDGSEISLNFHEKSGQGEITEEMVKELSSVDVLDQFQFTPLHWACYYGQLSSVRTLVQCGADVNKLAPDYISPLLLASAGGHNEIVKYLLQHKADINHTDVVGNTALMYASAGNHPHTCNELIAFHPNLTESNENGDTAYSLAIKNKSHLAQAVLENHIFSYFLK
ncbi:DNA-binding protein RFXANK [Phlebotomus papatasi]|uniref:DNA-binding protein RFXANK n=1 Tax=Phlebotomus papatasi TaxID=29031 RepID=UPI002483EDED|nr:DNA-binding protein RFXANK [Phlebotomus papatasi]